MDIIAVKKQLHKLKELLSLPSTDVCWSTYNSPDEVISDLALIENGISNNDPHSIEQLLHLLAPTGNLQEISISSGWGHEFLNIAEALDAALGKAGK